MKKRFTRILAALALLVGLTIPMGMWGQTRATETFAYGDYTGQGGPSGSGSEYTMVKTDVSISDTKFYGNTSFVNLYANGVSTITPASGVTITQIVLTATSTSYNGFQSSGTVTPSIGSISHDNTTVTWTGSANNAFTISHNKQIRWTEIVVTYTKAGAPTITADAVNFAYNETNKSISFSIVPATGASITNAEVTASNPSDWLTTGTITNNNGSGTVALACEANNTASQKTATVTLTCTYGSNQTTTKTVAVSQDGNPNVVNNIEDITALNTTYTVIGTVVATNNRGFVIGDGTGYVYTYLNELPSQAIGDKVRISGSTGSYGHILQFTNSATITTSTTSNYNGTPTIVTVDETAMAGFNSDYQLSDYVQYEGTLTKSTSSNNNTYYNIAVGTATARISYQTETQTTQLEALLNKTVKVKGYFAGFSSNIFTTMMESVEEVETPTINVSPATAEEFTYVSGNGPSEEQIFEVTGLNLTSTDITVSVEQNGAFEITDNEEYGYTLTIASGDMFSVRMKAGLEAGSYSGTVTLSSQDATDVTIDLTGTVTEPEAPHYTWDLSTNSYVQNPAPTANLIQWICDYATMKNEKGTGTAVNNYIPTARTSTRFYDGNNLTIAPTSGYAITSVEFTATSTGYATALANSTWHNATASASGTTVTVTPTDGNIEMVAAIGATCGFTAVTVYYTTSTADYYDVEILNALNGSVVANPNRAQAGATITLTATPNEYYYVSDWTILDGEANTIEWIDLGTDKTQVTFTMPASEVTVEATFATDHNVTTYILATTIESGKHYIITNGSDKAMGTQTNNNRAAAAVSISDGVASVIGNDVYEFVINGPDANGNYIIYDANELSTGYLYAISDNNYLRTQEFNDATGEWAISFNENKAIIQVTIGETTRIMRYNNGNNVFSCYTSGQQDIYLYVKDETNYTFYKDVTGFGDADNGNYYLLASPVAATPTNAGMITDDNTDPENLTYDLYSFDQTQDQEWRNYRAQSFGLDPGKGYLYANSQTTTVKFEGNQSNVTSVTLNKTTEQTADFAGWNLVGNPFGQVAYIAKDFYRMNEDGDDLIEGSDAINPMEGVFVIADYDEETLTFSTTAPAAPEEDLVVNLNSSRGTVIDRAVVRFGQGDQLPKFQINPNNTKIYVTEGNKDYAVVRSAAEAEMPVSFRASENGTYTLAVEAENVEMNYLHLIDNLTGMDVDLLQTPSYTFEAKTSDYASRFRLVFKANSTNENNAETFAYFNGTNWTVSNVGDATLQVVDVTGRTVANQMINGNAELNLNQPAGVYVIRLVNGDNVKTQKVVVR